jgi:hypothetical protein
MATTLIKPDIHVPGTQSTQPIKAWLESEKVHGEELYAPLHDLGVTQVDDLIRKPELLDQVCSGEKFDKVRARVKAALEELRKDAKKTDPDAAKIEAKPQPKKAPEQKDGAPSRVPHTHPIKAWLESEEVQAEELYAPLQKLKVTQVEDLIRKPELLDKVCPGEEFDVVRARVKAALEELRKNEKEADPEAGKRAEKLQQKIEEVEKLRVEVAKAVDEDDEKVKAAAADKVKTLLLKLNAKTLPDLDPKQASEWKELEASIGKCQEALGALKSDFPTDKFTGAALVYRLDLLKGFRVTPIGVGLRDDVPGELLQPPSEVEVKIPSDAIVDKSYSYVKIQGAADLTSTIQTLGSSFSMRAEASGGAFLGSGIGAMSLAVHYSKAKTEEYENSASRSSVSTERIQLTSSFYPMGMIALGTTLSAGASQAVQEIKNADPNEQEALIRKFYENYGTHYHATVLLGGKYDHEVRAQATNSEWTSGLTEAVGEVTELACSASASYWGLSGAVKATAGTKVTTDSSSGSVDKRSYKCNEQAISVSTSVVGGKPCVPIDIWRNSLDYNGNWKVIGGRAQVAVWDLLSQPYGAALAGKFESVWVKDFVEGLLGSMPGFEEKSLDKSFLASLQKATSVRDLAATLRNLQFPEPVRQAGAIGTPRTMMRGTVGSPLEMPDTAATAGFALASMQIAADGPRGSVVVSCGLLEGSAFAHANRRGDTWYACNSICMPVPAGAKWRAAFASSSGAPDARLLFVPSRLELGPAEVRIVGKHTSQAAGFLFVSLNAVTNGHRGQASCAVGGVDIARISVHQNTPSDERMNRSCFCVPVSAGSEYEIKSDPSSGNPEIKIWWIPLAGTGWALDQFAPVPLDQDCTEKRAATAGFLYGYIDCPHGARGAVKLQSSSDSTVLDTLSAASAHWNKPSDRWMPANSVMLPVANDAPYRVVKEFSSGSPLVKLFWTAVHKP